MFALPKNLIHWILSIALLLPGCGYRLRGSKNTALEREGIRKIYIAPIGNQTQVLGLETWVHTVLAQKISAESLVDIVNSEKDADAVLRGSITQAVMSGEAPTSSDLIAPTGLGRTDTVVFTQYRTTLSCSFQLFRSVQSTAPLWGAGFSRSKAFLANTTLGVLGTTSHLINDSEHRRALRELSSSMMAEVHDTLFDLF